MPKLKELFLKCTDNFIKWVPFLSKRNALRGGIHLEKAFL